jgi:hypothetical protein
VAQASKQIGATSGRRYPWFLLIDDTDGIIMSLESGDVCRWKVPRVRLCERVPGYLLWELRPPTEDVQTTAATTHPA